MGQRVTLEEIARKSNVSLATVSLVLRDKPGINDETRRRVRDIARGLGYRPRAQIDLLSAQSLQQVGVLVKTRAGDAPQTNHFYAHVIAGIEDACRRHHINLLIATVPVDADNHPQDLPRMLLEDDLDGLLLVGAFVDSTIAQLMARRSKSTVLVDAYAVGNAYDSVVSDNVHGAYQAVSYLIERGHRYIGLVGTLPNAYPSIADRCSGYLQALRDHGITHQYFAESHIATNEAAQTVSDLLRQFPQITALFCCNDMMAIAAMQAAQALGRHLPDELSVIGFDNIDLGEHVTPSLTTMHVDKVSMGRLAVQLLKNRADFPTASHVTAVLRPILVKRQSVCSLHDA